MKRPQGTTRAIRTRNRAIGTAIIAAGLAYGPAHAEEPSNVAEVRAAWEAYEADWNERDRFFNALESANLHESEEGWKLLREMIEHPGRVREHHVRTAGWAGGAPTGPYKPWHIERELAAYALSTGTLIPGDSSYPTLTLDEARIEWARLQEIPHDQGDPDRRILMEWTLFHEGLRNSSIAEEPGGVEFLLQVAGKDAKTMMAAMQALSYGGADAAPALVDLNERFLQVVGDDRVAYPVDGGSDVDRVALDQMRPVAASALARISLLKPSLAEPVWTAAAEAFHFDIVEGPGRTIASAFVPPGLLALGPGEFHNRLEAEFGTPLPTPIARAAAVSGLWMRYPGRSAVTNWDEVHAAHGDAAAEFLRSAAHDWWNHPEADSGLIGYYQGFAMDRDADQGERLAVLREGLAELEASALAENNPAAHAEARARFEVLIRYLEAGEEPVPRRREAR